VSEPVRRCVGCGRSAPQRDLLRFTEAVEKLVGAVHDLQVLSAAFPKPRQKKTVPMTSSPPPEVGEPALFNV